MFCKIFPSRSIGTASSPSIGQALRDSFGRRHNYLRLSIVDQCNLRCSYCMPEEGVKLGKAHEYLELDELKRLASAFVKLCGVTKIRLTGGEPTIAHVKLLPLLEHLQSLRPHGLQTVAMTTNGLTLKRLATTYKRLGLNSVNISLDTLRVDRYRKITRRNGLRLAHDGLVSALDAGFDSVKVNCVVMRGINDDEIGEFVGLARKYPLQVRFIEFMPFAGNDWKSNTVVTGREVIETAQRVEPELEPSSSGDANEGVSRVYTSPSLRGSIGIISSMSDLFCGGCNRLRITADGNLKVCLFGREETSLRDLMRNGATDAELAKSVLTSLKYKHWAHAGATTLKQNVSRPMVKIGPKVGMRAFHSSSRDRQSSDFSHLNTRGEANMVDVSQKKGLLRVAIAQGKIHVGRDALQTIHSQSASKGDVLAVARVAGIMAAKRTAHLIPLCHQVALSQVRLDFEACDESGSLKVIATSKARDSTGVEMESLTAVSVALLTIYDMCKSISKSMVIDEVKLISKTKDE